jgi:hypothetical protein
LQSAHQRSEQVSDARRDSNEGKTPAVSAGQARALLDAPPADTLRGKRDRAILSVFLYHRCGGPNSAG